MEALKYLSLISQVGFTMVTPVLLCTFVGIKLEGKFHFPFTLIFLLLGVISGCMSGYRLIMNSLKKMEKDGSLTATDSLYKPETLIKTGFQSYFFVNLFVILCSYL